MHQHAMMAEGLICSRCNAKAMRLAGALWRRQALVLHAHTFEWKFCSSLGQANLAYVLFCDCRARKWRRAVRCRGPAGADAPPASRRGARVAPACPPLCVRALWLFPAASGGACMRRCHGFHCNRAPCMIVARPPTLYGHRRGCTNCNSVLPCAQGRGFYRVRTVTQYMPVAANGPCPFASVTMQGLLCRPKCVCVGNPAGADPALRPASHWAANANSKPRLFRGEVHTECMRGSTHALHAQP